MMETVLKTTRIRGTIQDDLHVHIFLEFLFYTGFFERPGWRLCAAGLVFLYAVYLCLLYLNRIFLIKTNSCSRNVELLGTFAY